MLDLLLLTILAGILVGGGGFLLIGVLEWLGWESHHETKRVWNFLWITVTYTIALELLHLDIFVGGRRSLEYAIFLAFVTSITAGAIMYIRTGRLLPPLEDDGN